ncbi:hypothetical protein F5Y14DRAFT_402490 [Nemania sp. NC0429]|nr:hypothetical protein F5Y14DRAFT_402490 [Nemania sp. NC0429]
MARLNEPTVSADSLEILRRKFLRQNRDIARTNSTQSLKIRSLENECARLLSENLQLRSDVLRLKTELENSHAHRVADHALQIKQKMEAQLVEWGAMLASLGHEPTPKSRSPRAAKRAKIHKDSVSRTRASDWRRRETLGSVQDLEAAALQEGRLPPIWENKSYPRETLNRDEILALCSEAEESTDSPDLGPPPVSRFVDEDPVKLDLSTLTKILNPALGDSDTSGAEDNGHQPKSHPNSPIKFTKDQDTVQEPKGHQIEGVTESAKSAAESESQRAIQTVKTNLKRKTREEDEKENAPFLKSSLPAGTVTKIHAGKIIGEKANPTSRSIKELPPYRKDTREKSTEGTQRRPLGAKNSNEAIGSPQKKSAKAPTESKGAKPKVESKEDGSTKAQLKLQKEPVPIEIPPPSSPEAVIRADIEPESPSPKPKLSIPGSPEASISREELNDTPPPFDISSKGETTRANRRARAAVSYAEPNLRVKMRRPNTKELFDAVAGEGKNIRRTSQCQKDEPSSAPSSVAKSEAQFGSSRKNVPSQRTGNDAGQDVDVMASPLVQKTARASALEELPASVTTDRKRRDTTAITTQDHDTDTATARSIPKGVNQRLEQIAAREAEVANLFESSSDVYEFTDSSPNDASKETTAEGKEKMTKGSRQSRSRRLSSMGREDLQFNSPDENEKPPGKQTGSRKRASMAAIRSAKSGLEDMRSENSSADGDSSVSTVDGEVATNEKVGSSRRRTTML